MITVNDLNFSYTKRPFIENINFQVNAGEILGFLGPSGAGKSTLQKVLTGQIRKYAGRVSFNGRDLKQYGGEFYENIGVDFEFPSLYEKLTARQNLSFFSSLYKNAPRDIDGLLDEIGLLADADKKVGKFSKGMKSRLNFIKALVHKPEFLFLDEPTSGLDPANARIMKNMICKEQKAGRTIILTTHNMQDAAELCSRVAFIFEGKIKTLDTPHNLIMQKGGGRLNYSWIENGTEHTGECFLDKTGEETQLMDLITSGKLSSIHSGEPTLNEIFIEITGRALQ